MKKIFTLILAVMAIVIPIVAQESNGNSTQKPIVIKSLPIDDRPNQPVHRAPMRIGVEAYYDALTKTISIYYAGEAAGEVSLYRNGELTDNSCEINTTFTVAESGYYTIEITTESWVASGSIEI